MLTRREFGKLALSAAPAVMAGGSGAIVSAFAQARPNSLIDGVQIGTITYSFRSMPDESAEAVLKYVVDSGISAIELMGGPVESFAGRRHPAAAAVAAAWTRRRWSARRGRGAMRLRPSGRSRGTVSRAPCRKSVKAARAVAAAADAGAANRRPSSRRRSRSRRRS